MKLELKNVSVSPYDQDVLLAGGFTPASPTEWLRLPWPPDCGG